MNSYSFFNQTNIILILIVVIGIYYFGFWRYNKYLKNKDNVKNINNKVNDIKNIHILAKNIESVPFYNKKTIIPATDIKSNNNWGKILDDIQYQAEELNTNNSLDQYLSEMDIDTDD